MAEHNESVDVQIYGSPYRIRSTETTPPKYIQKIAAEVDKHMRKFAEGNPRLDYSRLAVLAAITLADERHKRERELKTEVMANEFEEAKASKALADVESKAKALEAAQAQITELQAAVAASEAKVEQMQRELLALEERMEQTQEATAQVEREDFTLEREFQQLKEDYAKLQNEFNEWIELAGNND